MFNPFQWFFTKLQKDSLYETAPKKDIQLNEINPIFNKNFQGEAKLITFNDAENFTHRFLYIPPKENGTTKVFFGGSDLELSRDNTSYLKFVSNLKKNDPQAGIVIPIYPGYHEKKRQPNEKIIKYSAEKICEAMLKPQNIKFKDNFGNNDMQDINIAPSSKLDLIGYSLGGPVATHVAQKIGAFAQNLILIACPSSIRDYSIKMASEVSIIFKKILNKFPNLFQEDFNTLGPLKNISSATEVSLIGSKNDQFSQKDHDYFSQIKNTLMASGKAKEQNIYDIDDSNLTHFEFMTNGKVIHTINRIIESSLSKQAAAPIPLKDSPQRAKEVLSNLKHKSKVTGWGKIAKEGDNTKPHPVAKDKTKQHKQLNKR